MADSDPEYDDAGSDDDVAMSVNGAGRSARSKGRAMVARPKERAQAKWEAAATSNWDLQEGADGSIEGVLGGLEEAGKRRRYELLRWGGFCHTDNPYQTAKRYDAVATRNYPPHITYPRSVDRDDGERLTTNKASTYDQLHHLFYP